MRWPRLLGQLRSELRTVRHRLIHPVPPPTVRKAAWRTPLTTTAPATAASRQRGRRTTSHRDVQDGSMTTAQSTAVMPLRGVPRLLAKAFPAPDPAPPSRIAEEELVEARRSIRGARMRARPIGGPNWCRPPTLRLLPFAWPDKIRLDSQGLYHPAHDSERRYCPHCHPKYADWAGVPVDPAVVPRTARCPENNRLWPNAAARPWHGPVPEFWTRPGKVPRWYVWWRLWGVQDGKCATCPGPPQVMDHDHTIGLVRGLLCYDCNAEEAACALDLALHWHSGICWYHRYWDSPPGAPFGWYWPDPQRQGGIQSFLPQPPAWTADATSLTVKCHKRCKTWIMRPHAGDDCPRGAPP
ncbi:endonuclease domain-containing protein [Streptomyces mirabilis]|uniref:endonuclease domain-containing protein n=1 Tax=Streptomyces mirabilis TaxID=68239 RepID=UPI0036A9223D